MTREEIEEISKLADELDRYGGGKLANIYRHLIAHIDQLEDELARVKAENDRLKFKSGNQVYICGSCGYAHGYYRVGYDCPLCDSCYNKLKGEADNAD
jgi:rubrerythrin